MAFSYEGNVKTICSLRVALAVHVGGGDVDVQCSYLLSLLALVQCSHCFCYYTASTSDAAAAQW